MIWRVWTWSLTIQVVVGSISLADMKPLLGPEQRSDESSLTVLVAYGLPLSPEIILICINLNEWLYNAYIWSDLFVKPIYNVDNNQNKDAILHHGSALRVNSSAGWLCVTVAFFLILTKSVHPHPDGKNRPKINCNKTTFSNTCWTKVKEK